jgi:hypothetical protein
MYANVSRDAYAETHVACVWSGIAACWNNRAIPQERGCFSFIIAIIIIITSDRKAMRFRAFPRFQGKSGGKAARREGRTSTNGTKSGGGRNGADAAR